MLVRRAVEEVWNRGHFAIIDELVASDIIIHSSRPGDEIHRPAGLKQFYATLHAAFPDIHFTIEDQIVEGDRVVTRWSARAMHTGEFQGIPSTGKQIGRPESISTASRGARSWNAGRLWTSWVCRDSLGLFLRQSRQAKRRAA